ncbi:MAG TPA: hypothetical protein VK487_04860 [Candidatus Bathyarchaeia archaeon]|nr:hypothetical protein [Candidatus Bathyarchaeia archaeon]
MTLDNKLQTFTEPVAEAKGVPRITYEDIGGLKEEAQRTREIVELPMRHPKIFQRLGIDPPKGVLLLGPRARIYTQLVTFENDDYVCKAATSVKEASELIEAGFEYVCDVTDVQLFRKRK